MPNKQTEHLIEEAALDILSYIDSCSNLDDLDWQEAQGVIGEIITTIATRSAERSNLKHLFPTDGRYQCWRENDKVLCFNLDNFKIGTEISTKEAAQLLGVTDRHIRRLIKEGKIKAVRHDEKEWKVIKEFLSKPKE